MSGSQLEQAITALIELFHKYSGRDDTIKKEPLLQLLKENFPNFLSACVSGALGPMGTGSWHDWSFPGWLWASQSHSLIFTFASAKVHHRTSYPVLYRGVKR